MSAKRFPGQYYDAESGLHYNWHRYYDPEIGRYITSDPLGLYDGPSTYGYAHQNPVMGSDPMGLLKVHIWNYRGYDTAWGHASMTLDNGTHISWWPGTTRDYKFPSQASWYPMYDADAFPNQTFADDVRMEGMLPDHSIEIKGLDEAEILKWWLKFKKSNKWKTLSQNCSTVIADALDAGGAGKYVWFADINLIWKPDDVKAYVDAIIEEQKECGC